MRSATLFALFLFSALSFYPPSTTAQPVLDANGNSVRNGGTYYILPRFWGGGGGGIKRAITGDETSPLSVVQSPFTADPGQAWRLQSLFASAFIPEGRIYISYDYVQQPGVPSNYWTAVEGEAEKTVVKVGYPNSLPGFFTIHRTSSVNSYKFQFCSNDDATSCSNVGIVRDDAGNRLLATNQETPFEFVLAPGSSVASK